MSKTFQSLLRIDLSINLKIGENMFQPEPYISLFLTILLHLNLSKR